MKATIYYSTLHMATNPAHVVDSALLQLESGSVGDLIGRILTKIEACKDEVKMTGQNSFRLVLQMKMTSCDGKTFLGAFLGGMDLQISLELYGGILLISIQLVAAQQASCHRCYGRLASIGE